MLSLGVVLALTGSLAACTSDAADPPPASAGPTAETPAPGVPSVPAGPPASTASAIGTSTMTPVEVGSPAPFGDGLEATVSSVKQVTLTAQAPGEVAGPGVAVGLTLRNGTDGRVDLGGIVVSTTFSDGAPGDISTSAPSDVPTGILESGESAEGVWVFSRPSGSSGGVEVTVSSVSSGAVVVIRG